MSLFPALIRYQIQETARKNNISLRKAAYVNAINKVAKVTVGSGRMFSS